MLQEAGQAMTPSEARRIKNEAQQTVEDMLDLAAAAADSAVTEVWKASKLNPELDHSLNAGTYAVIFAMAFGRIESSLIADLALAGLLHDIGISQVPYDSVTQDWKGMTPSVLEKYAQHVPFSLRLLQIYAPSTSQRVRTLIHQHHEKFDGTGYPNRLSGFNVDDVAQLLGMADVLDSLMTGQWDGKQRTMREALETIEKLEKAKTFPEYFNPEVFSAVLRWVRGTVNSELISEASKVVGSQAKEVIGR
jgi:HD-GYP domain-containing protein (c-di-GMP phosphodiesterase class II)